MQQISSLKLHSITENHNSRFKTPWQKLKKKRKKKQDPPPLQPLLQTCSLYRCAADMWISRWGCSYSVLCTRIMRRVICDCIYHNKFCTPTWADLESETARAKDLTSKLFVFGRTGCWFRRAPVCPGRANAYELWAALVQLPRHIFCYGLAQKAACVWGEISATWIDREKDEPPQECSLTWSELKGWYRHTHVCVPVPAGMD